MGKFFVEWISHNAQTDAWNFKQTKSFDTIDEAKKEFHTKLGEMIGYGNLDLFTIILFNAHGGVECKECWEAAEEAAEEVTE